MKRKLLIAALIFAIVSVVCAAYWRFTGDGRPEVHYPYVCVKCGAVFDVSELKEDYPHNWRIAPGGPSDSVVICLRCNEGWAYPVTVCEKCGTRYLLHRMPNAGCPKCNPAVARAAEAQGIDLIYHGQ